ncbi:MAG: hypothetical protein ACJAWL_001531 [Motiliproteus sp.]|jgi:hypothetical protein
MSMNVWVGLQPDIGSTLATLSDYFLPTERRPTNLPLSRHQSLLNIGQDIVDMLDADR